MIRCLDLRIYLAMETRNNDIGDNIGAICRNWREDTERL